MGGGGRRGGGGGSCRGGAAAAAQWGLPYAYAHFFSPVHTRAAIESYRRGFQPSRLLGKPRATAAVGVIVADTDEEARYLHASVRLVQRRIREGDRRPVASPEDALRELGREQSPAQLRIAAGGAEEGEFPRYFVGSPQTIRQSLGTFARSLDLDEIVVNTITHNHAARLRSYALLAEIFALGEARSSAALAG